MAVRVELGDALTRATPFLALKYAQRSYGVDRAAVERLGEDVARALPGVGQHLLVPGGRRIPARNVLFVGVPPISEFGYSDIRSFATRSLSVAAGMNALEVCMTLHGAGFGLDEFEAFRAQIAGLLDAVESDVAGPHLTRVLFLERNTRRVHLMESLLKDFWPQDADHRLSRTTSGLAGSGPAMAGLQASIPRAHAFVAMPFHESFGDRFYFGIAPQVRKIGLLCERMDESAFVGDVVETMKRRISTARVVVADVSTSNPNVYLEIGYAWACGVPTVLLCDSTTEPAFDIRGHRHLRFDTIRQLGDRLSAELEALLAPAYRSGTAVAAPDWG